MNGDAKSPQHTVVHPMYVSYTSIPTSASATMLSNKHHHQHSLSNSNHHLSNSSHAIASNSTLTNQHLHNQTQTQIQNQHQNSTTTTPTAAKKQFRSSNSSQQPSLHRQFLSAANATTNNNYNYNSNSNSNSNSNNNKNNSRHNANATATATSATNSNTFLIHTHKSNKSSSNNNSQYNLNRGLVGGGLGPGVAVAAGSFNGSLLSNSSQYQFNNHPLSGGSGSGRRRQDLSPMSTSYNTRSFSTNNSNASNSLLYSPKQSRKISPLTSNSIFPASTATAIDLVQKPPAQLSGYYDDSTAKADHQLYANGSRRHMMVSTPTQDTTPSLSYASLQNSNQNLNSSLKHQTGSGMTTSLSNSNYSLTNSLNNNNNHPPSPAPSALGGSSSGRFARIHSKPKPPKSSSYSNFSNANTSLSTNVHNGGVTTPTQRPDAKYPQMLNDRPLSTNFDETFEDDNFSMQNLKTDEGVTYVPFTKPTPGSYFVNNRENNNMPYHEEYVPSNNTGPSPNNNQNPSFINPHSPGILLEKGAILHPHVPDMNPAQRILYQQNGLPFHPAYSPVPYRQNSACSAQAPPPARPTNIPLPIVPASYSYQCSEMISPSEVTPPPPPQPRPHIFQPRTGTAPYPDLSPDVTERYAMPTQYIPRSPVASRIARRKREQQAQNQNNSSSNSHHDRSLVTNTSANFCDQIRDTPPGYRGGVGKGGPVPAAPSENSTIPLSRARSHDRLSGSQNGGSGSFREHDRSTPQKEPSKDMAPHVNRRSGRRGDIPKARPRSYCNSMSGGEGVIRANIAADRKMGYAA